jgi:hypothetical protein
MVGEVDLQRRDGDAALRHGVEVGAFAAFARVAGRADPVDRFAARIGLADHGLARMASAQPRDDARQLQRIGAVRDVHVQQPGRPVQAHLAQHLFGDGTRGGRRGIDLAPAFLGLRERDRRHAEEIPLHGRSHGAGVERVVSHVGAVVDAREHEVGPLAHHPGQGQVHAVGRRAVDHVHGVPARAPGLEDVERPPESQGVAGAAGVLLGGEHRDVA